MSDSAMSPPPDNTDPPVPAPVPAPATAESIGRRLAAQREMQGLSMEQVASRLNLAPRQVVALEADDFAALPGTPIVRGFIRSYAKLLQIDPAPLLAQLPNEQMQVTITPAVRSGQPFSESSRLSRAHGGGKPGRSRTVIVVIALLLVIAAALAGAHYAGLLPLSLLHGSQGGVPPSAAAQHGPAMQTEPSQTEELPARQTANSSAANANAEPAAAPSDSSNATTVPVAAGTTPASAASAAAPATTPSDDGAAPASKNVLNLAVHDDAWVEIRPVDAQGRAVGKPIVARLMKAGTNESFDIAPPVALTVGNASIVDAKYRGAPLDLKHAAKNKIARVILKQE